LPAATSTWSLPGRSIAWAARRSTCWTSCASFTHQQGLATSTPSGRAMSQMLGVFERAMIRERVTDAERVAAIVAALLPGPASAVLPAIWAWEWERCCGLQVQHSVLLLVSGNVV
jgi:hypothetical protein